MKKRDFLKKFVAGGIIAAAGLVSKNANARQGMTDEELAELAILLLESDDVSTVEDLKNIRSVQELTPAQQQRLAAIIRRGAEKLLQTSPWA